MFLIKSYLIGNAKNVYNKLNNEQKGDIETVFNKFVEKFALSEDEYMEKFNNLKFDLTDRPLNFSLKLEDLDKCMPGINQDYRAKMLRNTLIKRGPILTWDQCTH